MKTALDRYTPLCEGQYLELMRAKFGLIETKEEDASLIQDLLALMQLHHVDYTIFFRALGLFQSGSALLNEPLRDFFLDREAFDKWAHRYADRLREEGSRDDDRPGMHEPRQSQVRAPQLSGSDSYREGSAEGLLRD